MNTKRKLTSSFDTPFAQQNQKITAFDQNIIQQMPALRKVQQRSIDRRKNDDFVKAAAAITADQRFKHCDVTRDILQNPYQGQNRRKSSRRQQQEENVAIFPHLTEFTPSSSNAHVKENFTKTGRDSDDIQKISVRSFDPRYAKQNKVDLPMMGVKASRSQELERSKQITQEMIKENGNKIKQCIACNDRNCSSTKTGRNMDFGDFKVPIFESIEACDLHSARPNSETVKIKFI